MAMWRSAVLASLLSGSTLAGPRPREGGLDPNPLDDLDPAELVDTLASEFSDRDHTLAVGLDRRAAHLQRVEHPEAADRRLASETLSLLAPLAEHVGMSRHRALLEDASFRVLAPERYLTLCRELPRAELSVEELLDSTRELLAKEGIEATVSGRSKSVYSAHRKMLRKGLAPGELLDLTGLRVRVDTEAECYAVMDLLHRHYPAIEGSWDDYIAHPKPSGYRSLHTAVLIAEAPVEFQVRTHAMHEEAEQGPASHWRYKLRS